MTLRPFARSRALAACLGFPVLLAALSACGDDKPPAPDTVADVTPDTAEDATAEVTDDIGPEDTTDTTPDDVAETIDEVSDDTTTPPEPGAFVLGTADLDDEYVFKGVWAGQAGRIVAVGNDGVVAARGEGGAWDVLTSGDGTAIWNAVHGDTGNRLWAVGNNTAITRGTADSFGGPITCQEDADCADGNSCTINSCVDNVCQAASTGAPGCCGTSPASWDFDTGTLTPWTVSPGERVGPWDWRVVSVPARSTSGAHALYFGDASATPPTYNAPGQHVAGVVTSSSFRLPVSGTAALRFRIFLDAEDDPEYDYVAVEVDAAGVRTEIWHKRQLGAVPTAGFVDVEADLRPWLGQQIAIRVRFDSVDDSVNTFEGAYIDDMRVETACDGRGAVATTRGPSLWGVHAFASDFAVAVGQGGTILEWDGSTWSQPQGADSTASWNALAGMGGTLALVGDNGKASIARGSNFTAIQTGTTFHLNGVHMTSENDFVAVGDSGVVLMGAGTSWTRVQSGTGSDLVDVHGAAGDLYAVGDGGTVLHHDGAAWTAVTSGVSDNLMAVWRISATEVVAMGRGGKIATGSAATGFVDGGTLPGGGDVLDVWLSPDGTRMVTVGQTGKIHEKVGDGEWTLAESPTSQTLDAIWGTAGDDIWVAGRAGTLLHFDGTAWVRVESPVTAALAGIWGDAPNRYFAAGAGGTLLAYDGEAWSAATGGTRENLRAVHLRARGDGWAVGGNGAILRYRGLGWAPYVVPVGEEEDPFSTELHAVWSFSADDAWAVGAGGVVLRFDGTTWTEQEMDWTTTLRGLYALAPNDMWAVGNEGHILHWNGELWQKIDTGSIATLHAIHGDGAGHVIAVGSLGTVLELVRD